MHEYHNAISSHLDFHIIYVFSSLSAKSKILFWKNNVIYTRQHDKQKHFTTVASREKDIENRSSDEPEALFILSYHPSESIQPSLIFSLLDPFIFICLLSLSSSYAIQYAHIVEHKQLGNTMLTHVHGTPISVWLKGYFVLSCYILFTYYESWKVM